MHSCYDTWLAHPDCHEYTRGGNLNPPARSLICEWVNSSWQAVPVEMVKESFLSCAITTDTYDRDDHKVHCFKPGQPCGAKRSLLHTETQKLLTASRVNELDHDPFASDTDEEEAEKNEALIEEDEEELYESRMMHCKYHAQSYFTCMHFFHLFSHTSCYQHFIAMQ